MLVERMDFGGGRGVWILAGGGVFPKKKELCYPKASPASVDSWDGSLGRPSALCYCLHLKCPCKAICYAKGLVTSMWH